MAHITTLTRAYNDLHSSQANTYSYSGSFETFKETEDKLKLDGVLLTYNSSPSDNTQYSVNLTDKTIHVGGGNLSSGTLSIYPETDLGDPTLRAPYTAGSAITASDLTNNQLQVLRKAKEFDATKMSTTGASVMTGNINMGVGTNIVFEGATDDAHETTLTVTDPTADRTVTLPNATGTVPLLAVHSDTTITSTPAELNILDGVTSTASELNILDGVTSTTAELNILDGVTATATELNLLDGVTATTTELNLIDGVTATTAEINYVDGVTSNVQTQLNAKQPLDAELTTLAGMQTGTASVLADSTALTSTTTELNQLDGKTLGETTLSTASNTAIPTSKAVSDFVSGIVAPLGGFEAIADEDNFPTTIPAAGVIISIADATGITVGGSNSSTTARTAGNGSDNVTINGFPTSMNNAPVPASTGMLVISTGSSNTYTFHRLLPTTDDVRQLSDDVNDFFARYRVNAGEPGSNNDEGDLVYDTNADKMKVYDSTKSAWKEVTSTGEFKYLFLCPAGGSGAPTFNGSIATYDLREVSNSGSSASVTNAAQLIVSVNGVVQKANTGTSAPAEGFAMVDANTIIFGGNIPSGASVFVIQIGSAVSIPTPGDDTVSTVKLQNLACTQGKIANEAINEAKLQASNAPTNGYVLTAQSGNTGGMTWELPAAGATGGNSNANGVFWENQITVTHDYTIQTNYNAGSFGPLTINNGVTVTVPNNSVWTIV